MDDGDFVDGSGRAHGKDGERTGRLHTVTGDGDAGQRGRALWAERASRAREELAGMVDGIRHEVRQDGAWGVLGFVLDEDRARWERALTAVAVIVAAAGIVVTVAGAVGIAIARSVEALWDIGLPQTINDPVRAYLNGHSAGLPVSAKALHTTWLTATVVLGAWAILGSWGARVGCTLLGAMTTAMVWGGTVPASSRWTAAGITVTAWSLLSILAFRGAFRRPHTVILPVVTAPDRDRK